MHFPLGNVLMLSEGKSDIDNVYSLREGIHFFSLYQLLPLFTYFDLGILMLHLDKESYERAGLVGKPDGVKGKRGTKPRWGNFVALSTEDHADIDLVVEIELRLPSMLHGKKGFDRVVYAFKNVLNTPVTWLFVDLGAESRYFVFDIHYILTESSPNAQSDGSTFPDYQDGICRYSRTTSQDAFAQTPDRRRELVWR